MSYPFLSDEWIEAATALREASDVEPIVTHAVRMNLVVTGSPFEQIDLPAHVDTSSGQIVIDRGHLPQPDLEVRVDYETAKAILVDHNPQAAMNSFMEGKIVIQGDMTKLMAFQSTPVNPKAAELVNALRAITA